MTSLDPLRTDLLRRVQALEQQQTYVPRLGRIVTIHLPSDPFPIDDLPEGELLNEYFKARYDVQLLDGNLLDIPGDILANLPVLYPPVVTNPVGRIEVRTSEEGQRTHSHTAPQGSTSTDNEPDHYHDVQIILTSRTNPPPDMSSVEVSYLVVPQLNDKVLVGTYRAGRSLFYAITGFLTLHLPSSGSGTEEINREDG